MAINTGKGPLFSIEERVELVTAEIAAIARRNGTIIEVMPFNRLLMHFARQVGARMIVRGLRAVADFDYEFQMAGMNYRMDPEIETVFLMASERHQFIASKLVKEVALLWRRHLVLRSAAHARTCHATYPRLTVQGCGTRTTLPTGEQMRRRTLIATSVLGAILLMSETAPAQPKLDPENTLYMDLKDGRVVIELLPDLAPKHVARVKELTREGFYNNTPFHRVIPGFMAQGGDPTGTGTGGSKLPDLPAEFTNKAHFLRGTVGAARTQNPNSANSQFFICFAPAPSLDGQYTIWGRVVSGMEYVDHIKKGSGSSGSVQNPDRIVRMQVAADAKELSGRAELTC